MSNGALWATRTLPWANSRNAGRADSIGGAEATIELVMPVSTAMNGGICACGLTSVWNSPSTSPPRTLTAPISVIIAPPWTEAPVVSRSTTQKVMSRSGRPSSSKLICADHLLMCPTLGSSTDRSRQAGPGRVRRTELVGGGWWSRATTFPGRIEEPEMSVRIDCDTCLVRGLSCHDCVVTVLLGPPPELSFDSEEQQALEVLAESGLVPPLRMVTPVAGPEVESA